MTDIQKNLNDIIQELIKRTNNNEIKWDYIDREKHKELSDIYDNSVRNVLNMANLNNPTPFTGVSMTGDNFFTEVNGGYFILFEFSFSSNEPKQIRIIILPTLTAHMYDMYGNPQSELVRLHNAVKKQFPDVEEYLESVLKFFKKS